MECPNIAKVDEVLIEAKYGMVDRDRGKKAHFREGNSDETQIDVESGIVRDGSRNLTQHGVAKRGIECQVDLKNKRVRLIGVTSRSSN